jgi:hypothetical protein
MNESREQELLQVIEKLRDDLKTERFQSAELGRIQDSLSKRLEESQLKDIQLKNITYYCPLCTSRKFRLDEER